MQIETGQHRLTALDKWRGISVLLVIIHHYAHFRFQNYFSNNLTLHEILQTHELSVAPDLLRKIFYIWSKQIGHLGVDVFFVISGYIITHLLLREEARTGRVSLGAFYIRRSFRILPPLIAFIFFAVIISRLGVIDVRPANVGSVAAFLCNTTAVDCGYYFGHLWSLSVEEQFYFFWPLLFLLSPANSRIVIIFAALATCVLCSVLPGLTIYGWLNNGLSFGCITAGVAFAISPRFRMTFSARIPSWVSAALLLLVLPFVEGEIPKLLGVTTALTPFLIVATVLPFAAVPVSKTQRWLVSVGRLSYSLYLWHAIFVWPPNRVNSDFLLLSALPIGVLFAWLSAKYLEPAFIRLGKSLIAGYRRDATATV